MVTVFPLSTITSNETTSSNDIKFVDSIIIINGIISFVHVLPRHPLLTQFQNYIYKLMVKFHGHIKYEIKVQKNEVHSFVDLKYYHNFFFVSCWTRAID